MTTGQARTLIDGWLWEKLSLKSAGRRLARRVATGDATQFEMAGMFLVRAGQRSLPLLFDAQALSGVHRGRLMMVITDVKASAK